MPVGEECDTVYLPVMHAVINTPFTRAPTGASTHSCQLPSTDRAVGKRAFDKYIPF